MEVINEKRKVAGYKISIQKSVAFIYNNNELAEECIKKKIPFTITTNRIKSLGINLTEEVEDLYTKNYKTLLKEIEEEAKKWKSSSCSCIGRINIVKMFILPKVICRFSAIHIKIAITFFTEIEQKILNLSGTTKDPK